MFLVPVPLEADSKVIHDAVVVAYHEHCEVVLTFTFCEPPFFLMERVAGSRLTVHAVAGG